jgi:cystathionine beta-lyase/cystathionine gamma-synthase
MKERRLATKVTHSSRLIESATEPVSPPISLASVHRFRDIDTLAEVSSGRRPDWFYRRYGHLNSRLLEECVAGLEGADDAVALNAGMAACVSLFWSTFSPGDHVVATEDIYGGSYAFFTGPLKKLGVDVTLARFDPAEVERAIRPATKALFFETISNPLIKVADLPKFAALAKRRKLLTIVDSTFATPVHCRPHEFGIDLVYHSGTKFLGGHGDAMGGVITGTKEQIGRIRKLSIGIGTTMSPMDAWLIHRGIKTLHVRMQAASANAMALATFLSKHPRVERVNYPGLRNDPSRAAAKKILTGGFGSMLSFVVKGGSRSTKAFVRNLELVEMVPSLGDVTTTITHPWTSSHAYLPEKERIRLGVADSLIRVSTGIDDVQDVRDDFDQALKRS